jgi:hypothetical protein
MTYDQQCETARFAKRKDTSVHPNDLNDIGGGMRNGSLRYGKICSLSGILGFIGARRAIGPAHRSNPCPSGVQIGVVGKVGAAKSCTKEQLRPWNR